MKKLIILTTLSIILTGCFWDNDDFVIEKIVTIPQTPVNLSALNSEYDDYNSDIDPGEYRRIVFSSKRNSNGKNFDLIYKDLYFLEDTESGYLSIEVKEYDFEYGMPHYWAKIFRNVNTEKNELGPYFSGAGGNLFLMYSTENESGYDIQFLNLSDWYAAKYDSFDSIPKKIPNLNEFGDDLYPTFATDKRNLIFCSNNNDNVFNIYNASFETEINYELLLNGNIKTIDKIETLTSISNDKCPFVDDNNNIIVFTSDREGGFGGYDLWYSFYENEEWKEPVNFGNKINSRKDEFRPVIFNELGHNIMIFSSNRSGGMGGFDLYAVEIDFL